MDTEEKQETKVKGYHILMGVMLVGSFCGAMFMALKYSNIDRHPLKRDNVICTQETYNNHEYLFFQYPKCGVVHSPDCAKCTKKDNPSRDVVVKPPKAQTQNGETKRYIIMPTAQEKVPVKE